jgi:hypothetical protein
MMVPVFDLASRLLAKGGRLVYLFPIDTPSTGGASPSMPEHPLFVLKSCCEQKFSGMSRFCICMERNGIPSC